MKKLSVSKVSLIGAIAFGAQAANADVESLGAVRTGVYYSLTPEAATALQINLPRLANVLRLQSHQQLAFQFHEDGELDISIYEDGVFAKVRADIVRGL